MLPDVGFGIVGMYTLTMDVWVLGEIDAAGYETEGDHALSRPFDEKRRG